MASDLDTIVTVSVEASSNNLTRLGFGVPLILTYHTYWTDLYREYSSTAEMAEDGFKSYDDAYRMAQKEFAQDPAPEKVVVGRLDSPPAFTTRLEVTSATEGDTLELTYIEPSSGTEVDITRTVPAASSVGAEATAVAALIDAIDVDSLITDIASTAGTQTLSGASLNGAIGADTFDAPYRVSLTLSSHADWDATTATLTGYLASSGALVSESLAIPNGGNATVYSANTYTRIVSLAIPAQSGTGGTATLGTRSNVEAAVVDTSYVTLVPYTSNTGRRVHVKDLAHFDIEETTADANYDDALTTLQADNDDWFFIHINSGSDANVQAVATWVLDKTKLYFADVCGSGLLDGTSTLASDNASNERVVFYFSKNSAEFNSCGWVGVGSTQDPGFITWAHKQVDGQTDHRLTTTQISNLEEDNVNYHVTRRGRSDILNGVTASGEWIDVVHGVDALSARMQEAVYDVLTSNPKVAYTRKGMQLIRTAMLGVLQAFEGTEDRPGLIAPGTSQVTVPDPSTISGATKNTRILSGCRFSGDLAGAVHRVRISGRLA